MHRLIMLSLVFISVAVFGSLNSTSVMAAHEGHEHGGGTEVIIKGELVDSLCYVAMAAKGRGHKQCAIDCAKAGIPISILEDGTGKLYTVLPKEDKTGYPASVVNKMGEPVTLKGDLYEKGGNRYVTVESVE